MTRFESTLLVKSMTRSFAHEYVERKGKQRCKISEDNVPHDMQMMLTLAARLGRKMEPSRPIIPAVKLRFWAHLLGGRFFLQLRCLPSARTCRYATLNSSHAGRFARQPARNDALGMVLSIKAAPIRLPRSLPYECSRL